LVHRTIVLGVGSLFVWLGYRLFRAGVLDKTATDLQLVFGSNKVLLKAAAPGTVFTVLGAVIVVFALCRPATVTFKRIGDPGPVSPPVSGPAAQVAVVSTSGDSKTTDVKVNPPQPKPEPARVVERQTVSLIQDNEWAK
jgi:hypothetical protein